MISIAVRNWFQPIFTSMGSSRLLVTTLSFSMMNRNNILQQRFEGWIKVTLVMLITVSCTEKIDWELKYQKESLIVVEGS